jgi:transcriptional regulator with XRE-family HTH domain
MNGERAGRESEEEPAMAEDTSNLIRTWRRQLRMTQEEFAREIAVTVSTVNRWENGHAAPSKLAWRAVREFARRRGLIGNPFRKDAPAEDEPTERARVAQPAPVEAAVPPALPAASTLAATSWRAERAGRASH